MLNILLFYLITVDNEKNYTNSLIRVNPRLYNWPHGIPTLLCDVQITEARVEKTKA